MQTVQNARQQSQSYWQEWELLTQLYEKKMQEMAATDPNIKRIWDDYLKCRDLDDTEKTADMPEQNVEKEETEGR